MLRHLPNALTVSRGLAGLAVAWLLVAQDAHLAAFFLYIAAIFTDLFDGALAKRLNPGGTAGAWLDPLADKVLAGITWLALLAIGWVPVWLAAAILVRNVLVGVAWWVARARGVVIAPTLVGQLSVSYEGVTLPLLLLHVHWAGVHWMSAGVLLGVVTLALSVISAAEYALAWRAATAGQG
jgi:CDP-diacylglycerol--glycerol-3-phosphate 3-phosphatidyltransferase